MSVLNSKMYACMYQTIVPLLLCYYSKRCKKFLHSFLPLYIYIYIGWNDKIVVLKKTTLPLYFKTFIEKINSGNLII